MEGCHGSHVAESMDVERPIALLHTVYKSLLKLRWALIEEWLPVVREKMPWDAALPGNATADVAIKRVMRCEVSRVRASTMSHCTFD